MSEISDEERALRQKAFQAVTTALSQFQTRKPIDQTCPFCNQPLAVEGWPPSPPQSQWDVHCPCGKSNATFKGL